MDGFLSFGRYKPRLVGAFVLVSFAFMLFQKTEYQAEGDENTTLIQEKRIVSNVINNVARETQYSESELQISKRSLSDRNQKRSKWVPNANSLTHEALVRYMKAAGWPQHEWENVFKRAVCESNLKPGAINRANRNRSIDYGLLQINSVHRERFNLRDMNVLLDPETNLRLARELWEDEGWRPWRASNTCFKHGPNIDSRYGRDGWNWMPTLALNSSTT